MSFPFYAHPYPLPHGSLYKLHTFSISFDLYLSYQDMLNHCYNLPSLVLLNHSSGCDTTTATLVLRAARRLSTHSWVAEIFVVQERGENGFFLSWEYDDC